MGLGCVLELQPGWQLVPLDSYQNILGGASMKQGQDGTVPNILFPRSPVWVEGGVCPGKGQLPLPGEQRTQLALVVFSQGVWESSCHSALKGNALRVKGNHIPNSGFHGDGRQAAWLLPVSAKCDCNRRHSCFGSSFLWQFEKMQKVHRAWLVLVCSGPKPEVTEGALPRQQQWPRPAQEHRWNSKQRPQACPFCRTP